MTAQNTTDISSFLNGLNGDYIAQLYARYLQNSSSVPSDWGQLFGSLNDEERALIAEVKGASWDRNSVPYPDDYAPVEKVPAKGGKKDAAPQAVPAAAPAANSGMPQLTDAYRTYGHFAANTDPLGIKKPVGHPALAASRYGVDENSAGAQKIKSAYAGTIGAEIAHLYNLDEKEWLQSKIESGILQTKLSNDDRVQILKDLTRAEGLEHFLGKKYVGAKRFGLDGGETTIPVLEEIIRTGAKLGLKEVAIGMAHRGRLNVLTNIVNKPYVALLSEFEGTPAKPDDVQGSGDVKYHMGASADRNVNGVDMHVSLLANPSHLEAVNPLVCGKARAKQAQRNDSERSQVMGLLIHGDAAVAGQGLVMETFLLSNLKGYTTGGTMHVVINNQVGFTTSPEKTKSGPYCTDIAKMVNAPIFHVNAEDIDGAVQVARLAMDYRQAFKKDIVIDLVCYRRFGHNESDEPAFTQPQMYNVIRAKKPVLQLYTDQLVADGAITVDQAKKISSDFTAELDAAFEQAKSFKPKADWLQGSWAKITQSTSGKTAVSDDQVKRIAATIGKVPDGFDLNSKIARQMKSKDEMFASGAGFDWATAEALAFGATLDEGSTVRFTGQDVGRGTFSQRHAVLRDQTNEQDYAPLKHISDKQGAFEIYESPLSEAAVLGFEYGFSLSDPAALVLWEAQFGDFVNGAQVIIDQFITSSETKWLRLSGITMLLPHGFEGQGPEHSSARLERFLQACAEDNIRVANCSTPASYFHILRRQVKDKNRKPLIIMTPKSLLRHKLCVSPLSAMTGNSTFMPVLADDMKLDVKNVKRVVLCTGKVYYDLLEARTEKKLNDVALLRVEQLYPFPAEELATELKKYSNADVVWCQEEPENMGAWSFVDRRIERVLSDIGHRATRPAYVGRIAAASPATGSLKQHTKEQAALVADALTFGAAQEKTVEQAAKPQIAQKSKLAASGTAG